MGARILGVGRRLGAEASGAGVAACRLGECWLGNSSDVLHVGREHQCAWTRGQVVIVWLETGLRVSDKGIRADAADAGVGKVWI